MMRYLYSSRTLASKLIGADPAAVKEAFRADSRTLPCIYLFFLGEVKNLRQGMELPPTAASEYYVFKYGYTGDLPRRTSEHEKTFNPIKGTTLRLKYYSYIDPQYCAQAEVEVRDFFKTFGFHFSNNISTELAIVPKDKLRAIEQHYKQIGALYLGHVSELVNKLREAEMKAHINELQRRIESLESSREIDKLKHENELLRLTL